MKVVIEGYDMIVSSKKEMIKTLIVSIVLLSLYIVNFISVNIVEFKIMNFDMFIINYILGVFIVLIFLTLIVRSIYSNKKILLSIFILTISLSIIPFFADKTNKYFNVSYEYAHDSFVKGMVLSSSQADSFLDKLYYSYSVIFLPKGVLPEYLYKEFGDFNAASPLLYERYGKAGKAAIQDVKLTQAKLARMGTEKRKGVLKLEGIGLGNDFYKDKSLASILTIKKRGYAKQFLLQDGFENAIRINPDLMSEEQKGYILSKIYPWHFQISFIKITLYTLFLLLISIVIRLIFEILAR